MQLILKILKTDKIKGYIFLLVLLIFSINTIDLIINYTENKLNQEIINKKENRIMYIASKSISDKYRKIKSLSHIQEVYYSTPPFLALTNNFGNCYFKNLDPLVNVKIKDGNMPQEKSQVLISEKMLKNYNIKNSNIIDKKIIVTIENNQYELTVSGVYSDENQGEYLYIPNNSIINQFIKDKEYVALANSRKNFSEIEKELKKYDCYIKATNDSFERELQTYEDIDNIFTNFSIFCYILLILTLVLIVFYNITEKRFSIALLKAVGYSNIIIIKALMLSFLYILLFSFTITVSIFKIIELVLFYMFNFSNFINYTIIINNYCVILLLTMVIIFLSIQKIKKISIIKILKKREF